MSTTEQARETEKSLPLQYLCARQWKRIFYIIKSQSSPQALGSSRSFLTVELREHVKLARYHKHYNWRRRSREPRLTDRQVDR